MNYLDLCESWWKGWLADTLQISPDIRALFAMDALPEPYITFQSGNNPLFVLTTNPGGVMPHQQRENIFNNIDCSLNPNISYTEAANVLAKIYCTYLQKTPAGRRITTQNNLALSVGYSGVFQVESCPWHSKSLPDKSTFLKLLKSDQALTEYTQSLREFLVDKPVLVVSAVSSKTSISIENLTSSDWLGWQKELIGFDQSRCRLVPLVYKNEEKITSAALIDNSGPCVKVIVLTQGSNNFPSVEGQKILEKEWNSSC